MPRTRDKHPKSPALVNVTFRPEAEIRKCMLSIMPLRFGSLISRSMATPSSSIANS